MKVLLDEHLPHQLRPSLRPHDVFTVTWLKWNGTTNGALLALAASNGFAVMLTMDSFVGSALADRQRTNDKQSRCT